MIEIILHYLIRTLNYGNCGISLVMGNAGFISSTVAHLYIAPYMGSSLNEGSLFRSPI